MLTIMNNKKVLRFTVLIFVLSVIPLTRIIQPNCVFKVISKKFQAHECEARQIFQITRNFRIFFQSLF